MLTAFAVRYRKLEMSPFEQSADNRRRFPRYQCEHPIVVVFELGGQPVHLDGQCRMLSRGGFGAVVAGEVPTGRIVSIEFKARGMSTPISLEARVLYKDDTLNGFEFVAPDEQHRDVVATLFREAVGVSTSLEEQD